MVLVVKLKSSWLVRCFDAAASFHLPVRFAWPRTFGIAPSMAIAGLVLTAAGTADVTPMHVIDAAQKLDQRPVRLERLFRHYNCPAPYHIAEYIRAADRNHLDYRLLPAISIRESLCGVGEKQNNRWGFHPGGEGFPSIEAGITFLSQRLAQHPFYRGKTLQQKLFTYNPLPAYPDEVLRIMRQIE